MVETFDGREKEALEQQSSLAAVPHEKQTAINAVHESHVRKELKRNFQLIRLLILLCMMMTEELLGHSLQARSYLGQDR